MTRRPILAGLAVLLASVYSSAFSQSPHSAHAAILRSVFTAPTDPALTASHAKLIREFRVTWIPVETGAPGIDAVAPFGRGVNVLERAMQLLGTKDRSLAARILAESGRILPIYLASVKLAPGKYAVPADLKKYLSAPQTGVDSEGKFSFRVAHAALIQAANWSLVDRDSIEEVVGSGNVWPLPYIDGKRPYGDMSYFQLDMAKVLGEPYKTGPDGRAIADPAKDARLEALHFETMAALQVFLTHARPG